MTLRDIVICWASLCALAMLGAFTFGFIYAVLDLIGWV